mmetsp:Transcript_978/g.1225  ORF Transcript_978/g.1225 Transcript_978/m.1225 type:complete len:229 (+) Transcript_978:1701-2387(+)
MYLLIKMLVGFLILHIHSSRHLRHHTKPRFKSHSLRRNLKKDVSVQPKCLKNASLPVIKLTGRRYQLILILGFQFPTIYDQHANALQLLKYKAMAILLLTIPSFQHVDTTLSNLLLLAQLAEIFSSKQNQSNLESNCKKNLLLVVVSLLPHQNTKQFRAHPHQYPMLGVLSPKYHRLLQLLLDHKNLPLLHRSNQLRSFRTSGPPFSHRSNRTNFLHSFLNLFNFCWC